MDIGIFDGQHAVRFLDASPVEGVAIGRGAGRAILAKGERKDAFGGWRLHRTVVHLRLRPEPACARQRRFARRHRLRDENKRILLQRVDLRHDLRRAAFRVIRPLRQHLHHDLVAGDRQRPHHHVVAQRRAGDVQRGALLIDNQRQADEGPAAAAALGEQHSRSVLFVDHAVGDRVGQKPHLDHAGALGVDGLGVEAIFQQRHAIRRQSELTCMFASESGASGLTANSGVTESSRASSVARSGAKSEEASASKVAVVGEIAVVGGGEFVVGIAIHRLRLGRQRRRRDRELRHD